MDMKRVRLSGFGLRRRLFDPNVKSMVFDLGGFRYFVEKN